MFTNRKKLHTSANMGLVFSLLLFLTFMLCAVFTILIGGRVYENIRLRDSQTFHRDTVLAYITNKVRQADQADSISIREENGLPVLILTSEAGGTEYETWIYASEGQLRELFTPKDSGLTTDAGQNITDCESLAFSFEDLKNGSRILTVTLNSDSTARLLLRSSQKGGGSQ